MLPDLWTAYGQGVCVSLMTIERTEIVESVLSPPVKRAIGPHEYWIRYSHLTEQLTYEWVLNHPTGREEEEVFV